MGWVVQLFQKLSVTKKLPVSCSIFSAELYAIQAALQEIENLNHSKYIIYSDSLSALQAIENIDSSHVIGSQIHSWLVNLHHRKRRV